MKGRHSGDGDTDVPRIMVDGTKASMKGWDGELCGYNKASSRTMP